MDARAFAGDLQAAFGMVLGIDQQMAEPLGQRDEVAFGIDDGLLHPGRALFEQPAQQMRFSGAGIALHQQARRQQFLEVERRRRARRRMPHLDCDSHSSPKLLRRRLSNEGRGRRGKRGCSTQASVQQRWGA